ncbi:MAG: 6-hydroxycyclohex-1-ene-1-carbonyl-CoA dehydrogenase [Candidatus Krumholzibacteria bacterium]|nr:6-hydroxycyclohex-1-ene-1-carbonyl-CoA dehydrogenase [Candidatus Krumholzibacteria bacterium]
MKAIQAYGYSLDKPGKPLKRKEFVIDSLSAGEVVVRVAGCGVCHTDISFYTGEVKPKQLPVILGHEISGEVVAVGDDFGSLAGKNVVIPAVLPCGECDVCRSGRDNICPRQQFPGNDFDGGFASHVTVPGRFLCEIPADTGDYKISELAVIADAITTPYQSMLRSGLGSGDLAIVNGVGGIGTYMLQVVKNAGAVVIAIDVDERKLENAGRLGADHTVNAKGLSDSEVKKTVRNLVKEHKLPGRGWKVFETSGSAAGQKNAFALLSFGGTLVMVGFTMEKVNVRLSNIMAFDADVLGNWACKPEHYPAVVGEVLSGRINVRDNIEEHPLDSVNDILELALQHKLERRVVLVP